MNVDKGNNEVKKLYIKRMLLKIASFLVRNLWSLFFVYTSSYLLMCLNVIKRNYCTVVFNVPSL